MCIYCIQYQCDPKVKCLNTKHYISASYKLETEAFLPSVNYKFWRKSLIFNNEITDIQQRNRFFGSNQTLAANVLLVLFRNVMRAVSLHLQNCKI